MVDMSPEAVTQRLRMMDELWELSVKLMSAKKVVERRTKQRFERKIGERVERASQTREE